MQGAIVTQSKTLNEIFGRTPENREAASDAPMFVVRGNVTMLHIAKGRVNLLQGMRNKVAASGVAASIANMSGIAANSVMLALYDGEEVEHFVCFIGDQAVVGTFEHVNFKDGDEVHAVVTQIDQGTLFAHAVVRPKDGLLWMPYAVNQGRGGIAFWYVKLSGGLSIFGWIVLMILQWIHPLPGKSFIEVALIAAGLLLVVSGLIGYMSYRSSISGAMYAERIMKMLGFKWPWRVDLSHFSQLGLRIGRSHNVYDLRKALAAYGMRRKTAENHSSNKK